MQLHLEKTRIVHCTSDRYPQKAKNNKFDFLGYTFRTRWMMNKQRLIFQSFTPAVSKDASKAFRRKIKEYRLNKGIGSLAKLAEKINPIIRGWMNYFMLYGKGDCESNPVLMNIPEFTIVSSDFNFDIYEID